MDLRITNQLVPGVSSDIGATFIAGKPAPTSTASPSSHVQYLWAGNTRQNLPQVQRIPPLHLICSKIFHEIRPAPLSEAKWK